MCVCSCVCSWNYVQCAVRACVEFSSSCVEFYLSLFLSHSLFVYATGGEGVGRGDTVS
jgi:hypothetical protein